VHSVFVAGDYEIVKPGDDVVLAMRPQTWKFGSADLLATAVPVIREARHLFGDAPSPLLLAATPMAVDADSMSGTMLTDSIALFFPRPGRLLPAPLLGLLIGHEYFHR
jgi:hypothetical protein